MVNAILILGIFASVMIPVRFFQLWRGRLGVVRKQLSETNKAISGMGYCGLMMSALAWPALPAGLVLCPPWRSLCEGAAFMPLVILGPLYVITEFLLFPITARQLRAFSEKHQDA